MNSVVVLQVSLALLPLSISLSTQKKKKKKIVARSAELIVKALSPVNNPDGNKKEKKKSYALLSNIKILKLWEPGGGAPG